MSDRIAHALNLRPWLLAGVSALAIIFAAAAGAAATGFESAAAAYRRGEYASAFATFSRLAEQGDAKAQTVLGLMYAYGEGVPTDHRQAHAWYRRAAEQGHAAAQYSLAMQYARGEGTARNEGAAIEWLGLAAQSGHARAKRKLDELTSDAPDSGGLRTRRASQAAVRIGDGTEVVIPPATAARVSRLLGNSGPNAAGAGASSPADTASGPSTAALENRSEAAPRSTGRSQGAYRVQLAASRSEPNMRRNWARLQDRHANLLAEIDGAIERVEIGEERTVWYRLRVGPFPSKARARELCEKLREAGAKTGCMLVRAGG